MLCSLSTYRVVRLTSLGTKAFKQTVVRLETFLFSSMLFKSFVSYTAERESYQLDLWGIPPKKDKGTPVVMT